MIKFRYQQHNTSSCILDTLQSVNKMLWHTIQQRVTVIQVASDECMNNSLDCVVAKELPYTFQFIQLVNALLHNLVTYLSIFKF